MTTSFLRLQVQHPYVKNQAVVERMTRHSLPFQWPEGAVECLPRTCSSDATHRSGVVFHILNKHGMQYLTVYYSFHHL